MGEGTRIDLGDQLFNASFLCREYSTLSTSEMEHTCLLLYFITYAMKARVGCFKRTALKHVYYQGWNRSPAQVGCMRQALRPGALGRPGGSGWRGRWEGGSGWGRHVNSKKITKKIKIKKFQQKIELFILWIIFTPSAPEKHIQNTAGSCWPCGSNIILDKKPLPFP